MGSARSIPAFVSSPLSHDALELYFSFFDNIEIARRPQRTEPFVRTLGDQAVEAFRSDQLETKLALSDDGLLAVVASTRTGSQGFDLWEFRRTETGTFGPASQAAFAAINDADHQRDPHVTGDGLTLYYTQLDRFSGQSMIMRSTRIARTTAFDPPVMVGGLMATSAADPALSPDERVIVFSDQRPGDHRHLYYATRGQASDDFSNDRILGTSFGGYEIDAAFAADGCELLYASEGCCVVTGTTKLYRAIVR